MQLKTMRNTSNTYACTKRNDEKTLSRRNKTKKLCAIKVTRSITVCTEYNIGAVCIF